MSQALARPNHSCGKEETNLRADLFSLRAAGLGVGWAFAVVGFFVRAMRLGHEELSQKGKPPDYQL
jgi:hypothetical protein